MRALTYVVPDAKLQREIDWLNDNRIYPAIERYIDWDNYDKVFWQIGMIVAPADELAVKLHVQKFLLEHDWKRH